jgi:hypothetical protein
VSNEEAVAFAHYEYAQKQGLSGEWTAGFLLAAITQLTEQADADMFRACVLLAGCSAVW